MTIFDVGQHMVIDPEIVHGRLTFKGTRVPVSMVLAYLAKGKSIDEIVANWPQVPRGAIQEAIRLACECLHPRYVLEMDAADDEARRLWDGIDKRTRVQAKAEAQARRKAEIAAEFGDS